MSKTDFRTGMPAGPSSRVDKKISSPRAEKQRRRSPEERGLPAPEDLMSMARTYLEKQQKLWPKLVGTILPKEITEEVLNQMANRYRSSFLSGIPNEFIYEGEPAWNELGAGYERYSDKNSNPRSLNQQLKRILEKARYDDVFIPWEYVYFDAAVSGTTDDRTGYQLALKAITDPQSKFVYLFIDELGRANRNMVDALMLGRLMEQRGMYLIGCSDGFDMRNAMWKTLLGIFAGLQEWFSDQLSEKVNRGMDDAFDQGRNLGPAGFGYKLVPMVNEFGLPVMKNEKQLSSKIVDDDTRHWVVILFKLYAERNRSPESIARFFNRHEVGGRSTWDGSSIRKQLGKHLFAGIRIRNRTRQSKDPETGKTKIEVRPRNEWRVKRQRSLSIIPWSLWKKAQKRLEKCGEAYRKQSGVSRTEVYPETLVRPVCGCCGYPLQLGRSGKYAAFCCGNGSKGKKKCPFKGYKSVRIVEASIINEILSRTLTDDKLEALVQKANSYLTELASRPKLDTKPLYARARKLKAKLKRLANAIADGRSQSSTVLETIVEKEHELSLLHAEIREAEAEGVVPDHLTVETLKPHLSDLRTLLRRDIAVAAPILAKLTGTITVRQEEVQGNKKPMWIAEFSGDLLRGLLDLAKTKNCPTTGILEYLCTRSWTMGISGEVWCRQIPNYERIAPIAVDMVSKGASVETIGRATQTSWETVKNALNFAQTGELPRTKPQGKRTCKRNGPPKYQAISAEVVRRREQGESFVRIAREISVSVSTVTRAYDFGKRENLESAAAQGETPSRGRYRHMPAEKIEEVRRLLCIGSMNGADIGRQVGVGASTVYRERKKLAKKLVG